MKIRPEPVGVTLHRGISGFDGEGPSRPSPLLGLSYRVGFPRYQQMNDRSVVVLNKLTQGCPGFTSIVGFQMFRDAGLIAPSATYARLQINEDYYRDVGVRGESDAFDGWWNVVKDSFLRSYDSEYLARIKELNRGILRPDRLKPMLENAHARGNWMEADAAPRSMDCDPDEALQNMSEFVDARSEWIEEWTGIPN